MFSHSAGLGGAESCLVETIQALSGLGWRVTVVLPRRGPLENTVRALGVQSRVLPSRAWLTGTRRPLWKRLATLALDIPAVALGAILVASSRPALVVSNSAATPVGAMAAWLAGAPHAWYLHEFVGGQDGGPFFVLGDELSRSLMRRLGGRFLANSQTLARHYAAWLDTPEVPYAYQPVTVSFSPRGDLLTQEPGAPAQRPPGDQRLRCVLIGTIEENKNQEEAVRAMAHLRDSEAAVSLTIVGPARQGYLDGLRRLTTALALDHLVRIIPEYVPSSTILQQTDVLLVCSRREAFGRVTIEAMKCGLPVVGARNGGTTELLHDGETGFLYTAGDPADLAAKVLRLSGDAGLRHRLGQNAGQWAEQVCSAETYARSLEDFLTQARRDARAPASSAARS